MPKSKRKIPFRFLPLAKVFAEQWLPLLSKRETQTYIALIYFTYGFNKERDSIATPNCPISLNCPCAMSGTLSAPSKSTASSPSPKQRNKPNLYATNTPWSSLSLPAPNRGRQKRSRLPQIGAPQPAPFRGTTREVERSQPSSLSRPLRRINSSPYCPCHSPT